MPLTLAQEPHLSSARSAWIAAPFLGLLLALSALIGSATGALATPQQAPNSRVILDLPAGFTPSPMFSGFQNDATGTSFVILEAPGTEYDKMAQGFTAEELAKRGVTGAKTAALSRTDKHLYMRAEQSSPAGDYAKFFVLFQAGDQTILISANVPAQALEDGTVKVEDIERVLSTAKTTEKPAVRELYTLSELGPFKEAGTIVGTSKLYTLDGRIEPERAGETRSAFMVAPSLDKRPVANPDAQVVTLLGSLPGYRDFKPGEPREISIDGLSGYEVEADAVDTDDDKPVHLYQALLLGRDGGYYRLIGIATLPDTDGLAAQFPKIAKSFALTH
jgi:hypothetical protein